MSGGGKTQTSTSQVSVPPEVLARYNAVNAQAESVAGTPFQPYSSDPNAFVAPMTGTQNQAINQIANASTMAQPWFNMAGGATMAGMGPANLGELDTQKYMNPYTQYVVQNTADILGQQNQEAMSRSLGTAIQSGAGFGDRSGIAAANLARQQQMALGSTIGNLYNQGYTQAQNVAQQQQGAQLEAQQANLERLLRGGSQLGQLGSGLQGTALAGGQALLGAGTQEQQTNQAGLSALYNQFKEARAYPFQVAQFLSNIAMGTGALSGSTTTTTQPRPFFGLLNKGGRVGGGEGYRRGGLVPESMGGHVASEHSGEGYAVGGMPMDYSSMVMQQLFGGMNPSAGAYGQGNAGIGVGLGYVPQASLPVGELKVAQTPEAAQSSDLVGKATDVVDLADKATEMWEKFGPKPSVDPDVFKNLNNREGDVANLLAGARGGAIRPGLAAGGMPYDPTTNGYVPDNTPKQTPELAQAKTPADTNSGGLGDLIKLATMFMSTGGSAYANGGTAGRSGYLGGGFASDAALAELARKKKEQDILNELGSSQWTGLGAANPADGGNSDAAMAELARQRLVWQNLHQDRERRTLDELRSSDWSGGLGAANPAVTQPAPATPPAPAPAGGLASGQAALAATGDTAPSPLTYTREFSPLQKQALGVGVNEALKRIGSTINQRYTEAGQGDLGPFNLIGDMTLTPTQLRDVTKSREERAAMQNWYNSKRDFFANYPREMEAAKADPFAYYKANAEAERERSQFPGGIVPAGAGYTPGEIPAKGITTSGLSPAQMPPAPAPATPDAAPKVTADLPMPPPEGGVVPAAATDAVSAATSQAKGGFDMFADAFTRNEGSAINPNDPNGGTRWGFNADQYGKPLTEATKEDAIALGKKWWDAQGGDEIEKKYGSAFAAAYVDLSLIAPAWARSALEEANGDPAKFFENFKAKLAQSDNWDTYGKGWTNRINRDAAMAAGTAPVSADEGSGTDIAPAGGLRIGGDKTPSGGLAGDGDFWKQALGTEEGPGNVILPILVGLGKMISSRSPTLGGALIEGVGGGAEALMNRQSQLTNIAQQRAVTRGQNLLNVRNSIQTTANGDIVWTMQNGQPVPMYLGPYQALVGQGKYIQPLGYVPSGGQAEAALSQLGTQPIGGTEQPKVETGMPSFDANSEKLAADRGLSSEMTNTLNNDMRTLISSNIQYRESQKKISDEVEAGIVSDGLAAGGQSAFLNQLTSLLLNQPQDGVLVGGPLKELASQAIGLWNNVAKFNPALRDYMISEEDIASGAAINKLQAAGSLGSTSKLGENTRQALDLALKTIPGNELPVEAVREILAGLYVDKQRATDMEDALNAAKTYVAQMAPGMPGAYLAQNIAREFNSGDAAQRYATEKTQLEKVFALPFKVKEGVYVPVVDLLLKGVTMPDGSVMRITPEVFDATYGGGLNISRHILNASR